MIKNTNKNTLKKYSNDLDKRIKYLKYMNSQKYDADKSKDINDIKKRYYISENDKLKYHSTGESTLIIEKIEIIFKQNLIIQQKKV